MTEWALSQLALWGVPLLALTTYLSCLAMPVPSSLMMLAAGAFTASGDLSLVAVSSGALTGAILGDQTGYALARFGRGRLTRFTARSDARQRLMERAQKFLTRWGGTGVFLSRWLFSPLGPYMNLASGAGGLSWARFTTSGVAGEMVWVVLYVGLGAAFGDQIMLVADLTADLSGFLAGLVVTVGLGWLLLRLSRSRHHS
jgi:membrane-associated protein